MANEALSNGARRAAALERSACSEGLNGGADRQRRRAARFAALAFTGALFVGCLYDAADRCSPGTVLFGGTVCVCAEGSVLTDEGCLVCGENEVAGSGACVCASGFSRASEAAPCEGAPSALGVACDAANTPCTDATYSVCQVSGSAGYCTEGCSSSADCEGGFACDMAATPPYCRRPPTGAGQTCSADSDCAGTEATLCENRMSNRCVVVCDAAAPDCFPGTKCCDFTMFGAPAPFCLPDTSC